MSRRGEEGYVLAAALAALFSMSIVAAALVGTSLNEVRRIAAAERAAEDDAALDAAITLAATELVEEPRLRNLPFTDGQANTIVARRMIDLRAGWESDKLDLNLASSEAVDARLRAAGLGSADRATIRGALHTKRAGGQPVGLVDDVLGGVTAVECARTVLTVFGGRSDWTSASENATVKLGRPAPGSRIFVTATFAGAPTARGRQAVLLVTGDPAAPVRMMDIRTTRSGYEEGCHG
jgi:hypothetical protein